VKKITYLPKSGSSLMSYLLVSLCCRYLRYTLDKYVENDYTVVYFHFGLNSANKPSVSWLKRAYSDFDRK